MNQQRSLIGVGMGPGDPQLVTLAGVRALQQADCVLVPQTEESGAGVGRAEAIVLAVCPEAGIARVPFAMAERSGVGSKRRAAWETAAQTAVERFNSGAVRIVFATIGDPNIYSTFSYLAQHVRERVCGLEVGTIPGITAMQALAAASGTSLVEGREILALAPMTAGPERLAAALDVADSVVAYKIGARGEELRRLLSDRDRQAVVGVDIGLPGQRIGPAAQLLESTAYMATALSVPRRTGSGSSL